MCKSKLFLTALSMYDNSGVITCNHNLHKHYNSKTTTVCDYDSMRCLFCPLMAS